ncbi:MAG: actin-binding WH2 domain-containing protein, partial [Planctomycetota bacterium]
TFLYGVVMGSYNGFLQAISSGIKVPLLLSLAILICFPAFFIIQYALGSKLGFCQMFMIILSGFVITGLIMLSFAPIVIFFLITGCNYSFLKLLHVAIFALSGFFGMKTILDALRFSCEKKSVYPKIGVVVFRFWIIILAFVGMQLAWNLRPFVGSRDMQFELLRKREGNFYIAVLQSVGDLVSPPKKTNK